MPSGIRHIPTVFRLGGLIWLKTEIIEKVLRRAARMIEECRGKSFDERLNIGALNIIKQKISG